MNFPHKVLKSLRIQHNYEPGEVAALLDISKESYYDIEGNPFEVETVLSIDEIFALCAIYNIRPYQLFCVNYDNECGHAFALLLERLKVEMVRYSSDSDFDDLIGWEVSPILSSDKHIVSLPLCALKVLCRRLQVDWVAVLEDMQSHFKR